MRRNLIKITRETLDQILGITAYPIQSGVYSLVSSVESTCESWLLNTDEVQVREGELAALVVKDHCDIVTAKRRVCLQQALDYCCDKLGIKSNQFILEEV